MNTVLWSKQEAFGRTFWMTLLFWGIHMLFANQCRGATANSQRLQECTCLENLRTIDPNLVTKIAESLDIRWRCLCQWLFCYRYGYSKVQTWSKWLGIHRPQDRCPRLARHQLCLFLQGRPTVHLLQKVQWYMECSFVQSTIYKSVSFWYCQEDRVAFLYLDCFFFETWSDCQLASTRSFSIFHSTSVTDEIGENCLQHIHFFDV